MENWNLQLKVLRTEIQRINCKTRSLDRVAQTHNLCTACVCQKNRTSKRVYYTQTRITNDLCSQTLLCRHIRAFFFSKSTYLNMDGCMLIQTFSFHQQTHSHTEFISLIYLYLDLPDVGSRAGFLIRLYVSPLTILPKHFFASKLGISRLLSGERGECKE